jgi:protein arginine kinase activator
LQNNEIIGTTRTMLGVTCQICNKRPATAHLTELDPNSGQRQELHICSTCIQRLDLKLENGPPPIASILGMQPDDASSMKIKVIGNFSAPSRAKSDTVCPHCGLAFSEFGSGKLFGCAHDYATFGDKIEALLRNYHGTTRHIGRVPGSEPETPVDPITARRARLDASLRDAVVRENYEVAAALRDEIKNLDKPTAD